MSSSFEMAAVLKGLIIVRSSVKHCLYVHSAHTFIMKNDVAGSNAYFFKRSWTNYQQPFGNLTSQYWIGLERMHQLSLGNCSVRFDLQFTSGTWLYAEYSKFIVGNVSDKYRLNITGYSGNAGDAMLTHNGLRFSTYDSDNDGSGNNCASINSAGFWLIIIIIMNFYSPVSNTKCHSIGHKMRIARIKIRVDSQGRWEGA